MNDETQNTEAPNLETYPYLNTMLYRISISPVETSIALGHNWNRESEYWPANENGDNLEISIPTKITALASIIELALGCTQKVILSGGNTTKNPSLNITEAGGMFTFMGPLLEKLGINSDVVALENKSVDTVSNAVLSKKILGNSKSNRLVSVSYHLDIRAARIFRQNGVQISSELPSDKLVNEIVIFMEENPSHVVTTRLFPIKNTIIALNNDYIKYRSNPMLILHGSKYHWLSRLIVDQMPDSLRQKLLEIDRIGKFIEH